MSRFKSYPCFYKLNLASRSSINFYRVFAAAWTTWRDATKHAIAKHDAKMKAISMMSNKLMWKAWATWKTQYMALLQGHAHAEEKLLAYKRRFEVISNNILHFLK